jgi:hypothetical protein
MISSGVGSPPPRDTLQSWYSYRGVLLFLVSPLSSMEKARIGACSGPRFGIRGKLIISRMTKFGI